MSRSIAKLENNHTMPNPLLPCKPGCTWEEGVSGGVVFHSTVGRHSSVFQHPLLIHCLIFLFIELNLLCVLFNHINKLTRKCIRFFWGAVCVCETTGSQWVSLILTKKWPKDDCIQIYLLIQKFHLSNASMLRKHTI